METDWPDGQFRPATWWKSFATNCFPIGISSTSHPQNAPIIKIICSAFRFQWNSRAESHLPNKAANIQWVAHSAARRAVIFFNKKARELRRTWYTTQWAADAAQSRADAHSAETIFTSAISILSHAANQIWSIRMWLRNLPPPPREAKQWMIHLSLKWAPGRAPRLRNALFSLAYACAACVRLVFFLFIHWAT